MSYASTYSLATEAIRKSIIDPHNAEHKMIAIRHYESILSSVDITDYLLIDSKPRVPMDVFIESCFNTGTLYKTMAEMAKDLSLFRKAIDYFLRILRVKFEDEQATKQLTSIYTQMCYLSQPNMHNCLQLLQEALLFAADNETIHYNLGFVYQKLNKLELSIIHYKISISLCLTALALAKQKNNETKGIKQLLLNNYNGIACIYRSIKQWPESLFYLKKAAVVESEDPDVQNQLGVVYTEMRRTDLAEIAYKRAIKYYKKTFISQDPTFLLAEIYLNYGHMHSYNGDNNKSVEAYNKSLQIVPSFHLPFQNKIMNLSYLFDQLDDKMYILNQHKLVNKLYKKGNGRFRFDSSFFRTPKINIGIISGDFVDHPVSFFVSTLLKNFDADKFNVTCYSECLIDTSIFNPNLKFKFIKNMSAEDGASLIYNDKNHILLDLSGHTAFNRLDIFAMKPAPIQITYVGYPYSTGLDEMDYRITDLVCDNPNVSQKFYTEKLLYLNGCFLCYDPHVIKRTPEGDAFKFKTPALKSQPFLKNEGMMTIGCFNRLNKISDGVISLFNKILVNNKKVRFLFKTKALLNKQVTKTFLGKFDPSVRSRIEIMDCTILHEQHLDTYNNVDVAIDTFPYSGTTTSCEALYMGVPVFSMYDTKYYFHPQNVTASILKNTHESFQYYIASTAEEMMHKIGELGERSREFWETLKPTIRSTFLNGGVCNKELYMNNMSQLFVNLFNQHSELK